jgi:hypothetical protein
MTRTARNALARTVATLVAAALAVTGLATLTVNVAGASSSPAASLARQLLSEAVLPPSAVLAHPSTVVVCQCEAASSGGPITSFHHFYIVPGPPSSIESFLSSHVPTGATFGGEGTSSSSTGPEILSTAFIFAANGPHLYLKQLSYSMTERTATTSWLRVDSQVVWIPSRGALDKITGVVSATATGYETTSLMGSTGAVSVRLDTAQLDQLLRTVNTLPLAPTSVCMENVNAFQVTLRLKDGATMRIYNGDCNGFFESVSLLSGATATHTFTLSDRSCGLIAIVSSLFGAHTAKGTYTALHYCEAAK